MQALSHVREAVDARELGASVLEYLARSVERALRARASLPAERFHDVFYQDFIADPIQSVRSSYAAFGLPLDDDTLASMQQHVRKSPRNRHGEHRYTLEQFGLTKERVHERFGDYLQRFEVAQCASQ
jgi:hypothetical protein